MALAQTMRLAKNWDLHVADAETVARTPGFTELRQHITDCAGITRNDVVLDVGAGTGLLTLAIAGRAQQVWAIDLSPRMVSYLETKAKSAGLDNVTVALAPAISVPLVDGSVDAYLSNYCFHHLRHADKDRALSEAFRVLKPGGRLVIGDVMFALNGRTRRDRQVMRRATRRMLEHGPAGVARLARHALRQIIGTGEHPADTEWWKRALTRAGFEGVEAHELPHEGGVVWATRPSPTHLTENGPRADHRPRPSCRGSYSTSLMGQAKAARTSTAGSR